MLDRGAPEWVTERSEIWFADEEGGCVVVRRRFRVALTGSCEVCVVVGREDDEGFSVYEG